MAEKVYLVQCWNKAGALVNNYETIVSSVPELRQLKKFLDAKHGHVVLTERKKRGK